MSQHEHIACVLVVCMLKLVVINALTIYWPQQYIVDSKRWFANTTSILCFSELFCCCYCCCCWCVCLKTESNTQLVFALLYRLRCSILLQCVKYNVTLHLLWQCTKFAWTWEREQRLIIALVLVSLELRLGRCDRCKWA